MRFDDLMADWFQRRTEQRAEGWIVVDDEYWSHIGCLRAANQPESQ
jgi:hypothetical protein